MALTYTYPDAYLSPLVTESREAEAIAYVSNLGTLPAYWVTYLTQLRAYIITCLECQQAPDDLFATKLAAYQKQWPLAFSQAQIAQAASTANQPGQQGNGGAFFAIDLVRA